MQSPVLDNRGARIEGSEGPFSTADFHASVGEVRANVSCINCTSPLVPELSDVLLTPRASTDATNIANEAFTIVAHVIEEGFAQVLLDRFIKDAPSKCPHNEAFDPDFVSTEYEPFTVAETKDSARTLIMLAVSVGVLSALAVASALRARFVSRRRFRNVVATLSREEVLQVWRKQKREKAALALLDSRTDSLFQSPDIPRIVRLLIPVIILVNMAFFLTGHLSPGATVNVIVGIAGQELNVENVLTFAMMESVIDIWNGTSTCESVGLARLRLSYIQ